LFIFRQCVRDTRPESYINFRLFSGNAYLLQDQNRILIFVYFQAMRTCYKTSTLFQFSFIFRQCVRVTGPQSSFNFRLFSVNAYVLQDQYLILIFVYFQAMRMCYRTRTLYSFSFIFRQCLRVTGPDSYFKFRLLSGNAYVLQDQYLILIFVYFEAMRTCYRNIILF